MATTPIELLQLSPTVFCLIEPVNDGFRCWVERFSPDGYYRSDPFVVAGGREVVDGYLQALIEFGELSFTVYRPPECLGVVRLKLAGLIRPKTDCSPSL